jgi:hypothetical protein
MSDDLSDRGPADRSRISLGEDWEVQWWTKALGVSEENLREAVAAVGNSANAVREHLGARSRSRS